MSARYAAYFIPEPGTALATLGSAVLGRNGETGRDIPQAHLSGFSMARLRDMTEKPRRYGLHATLKAPFFLQPGMTEQELLDAAAQFVSGRKAITLPCLELTRIGSFFALVPSTGRPAEREAARRIRDLAADAVTAFDPFRAAPSPEEISRRRPDTLTVRQRAFLTKWGYPYVFSEYRFHVTLTGDVADNLERQIMEKSLQDFFGSDLEEPVSVSGICICKQTTSDRQATDRPEYGKFTVLKRFQFAEHDSLVAKSRTPLLTLRRLSF